MDEEVAKDDLDGKEPMEASPEEWLDEHGHVLFGYALARVRNREIAEDLLQETLVAAIRAVDSYRGQSTVRTWLVGILRNKIMDHFRQDKRVQLANGMDKIGEAATEDFNQNQVWATELLKWPNDPSGTLVEQEFWNVFENCLEKLPPLLFSAYSMREIDSCETTEVCDVLGITPTNLSVRLFRARMLLRRCLEQNWFGKPDSNTT